MRTLVLVSGYGVNDTPHARIIHETMVLWLVVLREFIWNYAIADIRLAWANAVEHLRLKRKHKLDEPHTYMITYREIRGIMTSMISLLVQSGWKPTASDVWQALNGDDWALADSFAAPHHPYQFNWSKQPV